MEKILKQVIDIVKKVGREISHRAFSIYEKEGASNLVTSCDLYAQERLSKSLRALIKGSAFLGEEGFEKTNAEYLWIVDPIDGTTNFSRKIDEYAISVALCKADEVVLGVVYSPAQKAVYSALKGKGAWKNGKEIRVSDRPFEAGILCTAASLYDKRFAGLCFDIIQELYQRANDIRRFGSCALELCYLAEGKCDLYFEIRVFSWDCFAALLVLQEAGGRASSISPYAFTKNEKPFPIIAANGAENLAAIKNVVEKYITKEIY